jgi:hypothetical protein
MNIPKTMKMKVTSRRLSSGGKVWAEAVTSA